GGQVGRELTERLGATGLDHAALDVCDADALRRVFAALEPDVVVHCAAYTNVDRAEAEPEEALRVNAQGTRNVVQATDAYVVYLSTDYVFDGTKQEPYVEHDVPKPISAYGQSKLAGEAELDPSRHLIVRTSMVCGRYGANIVKTIVRLLAGDGPLRFV